MQMVVPVARSVCMVMGQHFSVRTDMDVFLGTHQLNCDAAFFLATSASTAHFSNFLVVCGTDLSRWVSGVEKTGNFSSMRSLFKVG
jgi:hypothetical protein